MDQAVRDRFFKKVSKRPTKKGCLVWIGYRTKGGYGTFSISKRRCTTAHRVAWEFENGPIPGKLWVLHRCDNPPCVRVEHLFLGTPQENSLDAKSKGRLPSGADHWARRRPDAVLRGARHYLVAYPDRVRRGSSMGQAAKLTDQDVIAIRKSWRALGRNKLALKYGVHEVTIHSILTGKTWGHLPLGDYDPAVAKILSPHRRTRRRLAAFKLTPHKVQTIRQMFHRGGITKIALAKKYGVTDATICSIISGKTWAHLPVGD